LKLNPYVFYDLVHANYKSSSATQREVNFLLDTILKKRQRFIKNRGFRDFISKDKFMNKLRILEVGFGTGRFLVEFLNRGLFIDGVEPDEECIFEFYKKLRVSGFFISPVNLGKRLILKLENRFLNLLNNIFNNSVGYEERLLISLIESPRIKYSESDNAHNTSPTVISHLVKQSKELAILINSFTKENEVYLLSEVKEQLGLSQYHGKLYHFDFKKLNFSSFAKKYHLIFLAYNSFFEVACSIFQADRVLKTLYKILEPGGILIIQNDNPNQLCLDSFYFHLESESGHFKLRYTMKKARFDKVHNILVSEETVFAEDSLISEGIVTQKWWTPDEMQLLAKGNKFRKARFLDAGSLGYYTKDSLGEYFLVLEKR
jgi:SAM-dependent methyltransferase